MLRKLSDEQQSAILEAGIAAFAERGPDKASIAEIARAAGVSVGVLYKYHQNKDAFFEACLRHALETLETIIGDVLAADEKILSRAERLIRALQASARQHPAYHVLYHEITAGGCRRYAAAFARQIEGISATAYRVFIEQAQQKGEIRKDADPRLFAFFFDSLLMMLQYSYCCEYYMERFRIFCGDEVVADDERVVAELLKFFESAFTTEQTQIPHSM